METDKESQPDRRFTVLIVDDQALCREGLRELMRHWKEFEVVGEATNGLEAAKACRRLNPDLVLMDVQMPLMDGVEATGIILQERPLTTVVMLTVSAEDEHLFGAIRNGAQGYVLKDMPSRQLHDRLRGAMRGEAALSGMVASKILKEINEISIGRDASAKDAQMAAIANRFSPREMEILKLVASGMSNNEIGAELFLGAGTVKKHLSVIMQKLGLDNRVQVAVFAIQAGLAE